MLAHTEGLLNDDPSIWIQTAYSLDDYAKWALESADPGSVTQDATKFEGNITFMDAVNYAYNGWMKELPKALSIATESVKSVLETHHSEDFNAHWDVAGAFVDTGAYLAGDPECMISFPTIPDEITDKTVTIVNSMSYSANIKEQTIKKRGQVVVALCIALEQLGYTTEVWSDSTPVDGGQLIQRVRVKSLDTKTDPAMLMFGVGHPAVLRHLAFGLRDGLSRPDPVTGSRKWQYFGSGLPSARPEAYVKMYPEGTIFLPQIRSQWDVPNADDFIRAELRKLGILKDEG